jgi:hypothetical protein
LLDLINASTPTEVILFEVAKEADTRKVTQRIAELMYTVLLRELGYSEDFDISQSWKSNWRPKASCLSSSPPARHC